MYQDILLLMDCSGVDQSILDHVSELARIHHSKVHLFHVIHAHTLDQRRILETRAIECLTAAAAKMQGEGVEARYSLSEGEPSDEVLKKIEGSSFDLIAMATHGHRGLGDVILGSLSRTLKHSIELPLLLLRGES